MALMCMTTSLLQCTCSWSQKVRLVSYTGPNISKLPRRGSLPAGARPARRRACRAAPAAAWTGAAPPCVSAGAPGWPPPAAGPAPGCGPAGPRRSARLQELGGFRRVAFQDKAPPHALCGAPPGAPLRKLGVRTPSCLARESLSGALSLTAGSKTRPPQGQRSQNKDSVRLHDLPPTSRSSSRVSSRAWVATRIPATAVAA